MNSWQASFKALLKSTLRVAIIVFVLFEVGGTLCLNLLMFHPGMARRRYDASAEGYLNLGTKEEPLAALAFGPKRGRKALIRCHGNAENMYESVGVLRALTAFGYTVAAVDYPGYGLSAGSPTEEGCYRSVHRLYDWLVKERGFDPQDIVVDGFSIGTGPALELAATREVGGLILEAPFLSAPRAVTGVRLLPVDPFPNVRRMDGWLRCPLLIVHGTDDRVVPFRQGQELFRRSRFPAPEHARHFVPVPGAGHTDIPYAMGEGEYLRMIADFSEAPDFFGRTEPPSAVVTAGTDVDCGCFDGLWGWRTLCNPFVAGIVFVALLLASLLTVRHFRRKRVAARHLAACRAVADGLKSARVEVKPAAPKPVDGAFHVDANTMSLGINKLVQTGTDLDKGAMG